MGTIAEAMREQAGRLLRRAPERVRVPFDDDAVRRWIEYRPRPRPGVCLAELDPAARKAAHRLLATGLRPHAFAQAMTIAGLEEVLDRAEGYRRGRHSDDYWVVVFGEPAPARAWGWRFEGHRSRPAPGRLSRHRLLDPGADRPTLPAAHGPFGRR